MQNHLVAATIHALWYTHLVLGLFNGTLESSPGVGSESGQEKYGESKLTHLSLSSGSKDNTGFERKLN
jgi:hypothetical protein